MSRTIGLFRIMCRDAAPELRTVETRNGETSVLNLNIVQYFTPGDYATPWAKLTLWGNQAETYINLIEHNQAVYIDGDIQYENFITKAKNADGEDWDINRFSVKFNKVNEFRLVNVVKPPRQEDSGTSERASETPSPVVQAAANAANTAYDEMPF